MIEIGQGARSLSTAALAFLGLYGVLAAPQLWRAPDYALLVPSIVLAAMLAVLSAIDLQQFRLPNALTLPLAAIGVLVSARSGMDALLWSVLSALLGFAVLAALAALYRYLRSRTGMGLGDAKLLAAAGAWVGAQSLPAVLLWATGPALVCALLAYWRGRPLSASTRLPFGPFLAAATWLVWLYGPI